MKDVARATELAETMAGIGAAHGTRVVALLTDMSQPLGRTIGNAVEIEESLDVLEGRGPADLTEIVLALGAEMLRAAGVAADEDDARRRLTAAVDSGEAMDRFRAVIESQGGDPGVIENRRLLPSARAVHDVVAESSGFVVRCDALDLGLASVRLGAGRQRKEDDVDAAVGITLHAKVGDEIAAGDRLASVAYNADDRLASALPLVGRAFVIAPSPVDPPDLVVGRIG
jgi:thymidine phosphorylase